MAQAFILSEEFLNIETGAWTLNDNIFYGNVLRKVLKTVVEDANDRATVFGYYVTGSAHFDENRYAISIGEKL